MRLISFLLSGVCHQVAGHCLVYDGRPLPLCARCAGTFLGMVLAWLVLRITERGRPSELPPAGALAVFVLLGAAWALDGANSLAAVALGKSLYPPSNSLRLATGLGLGMGLGTLLYPIYHAAMWRAHDARRAASRAWQLVSMLVAGAALVALLLCWRSAPYWLWTGLAISATLASLGVANATLLLLLARRDGRGERWAGSLPWLAMGLFVAVTEMALLALARAVLVGRA